MESLKVKNRLLICNFSVGEIMLNLLFLMGSLYFLTGHQLYIMIGINLCIIAKHVYVLTWSFKHKVYDSEIIMQTQKGHLIFSTALVFIGNSIKILAIYFLLTVGGKFLIDLGIVEKISNSLWAIFIGVFVIGVITYKVLVMYVSSIMDKIDNTYLQERQDLIEKFKLDQKETDFCMNESALTGFISSGWFYALDRGLISHDIVFTETAVLDYLKMNDIGFNELDNNHIQIMRMYTI